MTEIKYPTLSVLMPVYNEEPTLLACLDRVLASPHATEIIIVDDGSKDGTAEIIKNISNKRVKTFLHGKNQGKGTAVRTALAHATSEYIIIQDADLEYDPEDFAKLLKPAADGKSEAVYGSRFTGEHRNMMFWHLMGNKFLSFTTNLLYNTTLSDMETCYKLIKRDVIKDIKLRSHRFDFEPEITAKLLKRGIKIYEVPISYAGREFDEGKKITWRDGIVALWTLIKYKFME
ncbi:MAG TPA: glycosyltransferase family 2 protein [Gammaproteobacteria bacterium]|nr:glycosyltransferase family 2 protein [Gammaproteobacteria bacterium]